MRKKRQRRRKMIHTAIASFFFIICCALIFGMAFAMGTESTAKEQVSELSLNAMSGFDMYINNLTSGAMDGVLPIAKVYYLTDDVVVAPEPNQELFGSSQDPADTVGLLESASGLLGDDETLWQPDKVLMIGSSVRWYLDETILAINWKEVLNGCVYTFTEVKIAHPSQFRRYMAGDAFSSPTQYVPSSMAASVNAVAAMNGDFYKFRNMGIVVYKGELYRTQGERVDTCLVDSNGDMHFVKRGELTDEDEVRRYIEENDIKFSLAFGPVLIEDGEIVAPQTYIIGEINDRYTRSAICQLGPCHYLMVASSAESGYNNVPTIRIFADTLHEMGIPNAYTLDGGQTATIIMNDKVINRVVYDAERAISDIIYFATAIPERE